MTSYPIISKNAFVTSSLYKSIIKIKPISIIYQGGLGSPDNPEQVMIALEPEAAAVCCLEKNMSEFQSETGSSSVEGLLCQPNTHYMVVDIGGNTS